MYNNFTVELYNIIVYLVLVTNMFMEPRVFLNIIFKINRMNFVDL